MGKIIISERVSLDGVIQDPTGGEGFRHGGWSNQFLDKVREEWAKVETDEALGAEALLLGLRSYEYFAARFPSRSGEWADRLNSMPKYVVSCKGTIGCPGVPVRRSASGGTSVRVHRARKGERRSAP